MPVCDRSPRHSVGSGASLQLNAAKAMAPLTEKGGHGLQEGLLTLPLVVFFQLNGEPSARQVGLPALSLSPDCVYFSAAETSSVVQYVCLPYQVSDGSLGSERKIGLYICTEISVAISSSFTSR